MVGRAERSEAQQDAKTFYSLGFALPSPVYDMAHPPDLHIFTFR
jgi:hypothetical protein